MAQRDKDDLETEAQKERTGLLVEFVYFLSHNKKWWLIPIIIVLLVLAILIILGGTPLAPFIYAIF